MENKCYWDMKSEKCSNGAWMKDHWGECPVKGADLVTEIKLTIKVPTQRVDEVSQKVLDLLSELNVYDGGRLEQSNATIDL